MKLISLNINYYPTWEEMMCNLIEQIIIEKETRKRNEAAANQAALDK